MKSFVTFALSLSLLAVWMLGCATTRQPVLFWVKPGGTNDALNKDIYACTQESQQRVSESSYNRGTGGSSTSGVTTNVNLYNLCMNARGWVLEEDAYGFEPKSSKKTTSEDQPKVVKEEPTATPQAAPVAQPVAQISENKSESSVANQKPSPSSTSMVVINSKAKLRKRPSKKAAVIKTLKKGEVVQVIKLKDEWCLIELAGGETGWCAKGSLAQRN